VTLGDQQGTAVEVEVRPAAPDGGEPRRFPIEGGRAIVRGARPGDRLIVRSVAEGESTLGGEVPFEDGVHPLTLTDRAAIRGQAAFSESQPAAGQEMVATFSRAHDSSIAITFRTDAEGAFSFEAPAGHDVLVELRASGTAAGADVDARVFHRPMLEPCTTWDLGRVAFEQLVMMAEGRVEDADGRPVPDATVLVLPIALETRALTGRTDPEGRFQVRGPAQPGPIEVFAMTEDSAGRTAEAVRQGATGVRLVLQPAGSVRGRVASPASSLNPLLRIELRTELGNLYATTPVLSDGTFEFPHVAAGRYALVVEAPDRRSEGLSPIEVSAGAASPDPRLGLVRVSTELVPARLRVVDASGAPAPGARVEVLLTPSATLLARTGPDGSADVVVPKEGTAALAVALAGFESHRAPWDGRRVVTLVPPAGPASR
jgi:hypothetical protein